MPSGVYWRRRLAVLSVALVVFLGVGKVLGNGSDGSSDDKASQAGATTSTSPTATVPASDPTKSGQGRQGWQGREGRQGREGPRPRPRRPRRRLLLRRCCPTRRPCSDTDVFITATAAAPIGGSDIMFLLNLQTRENVACTWQVSPETVVMEIVSGHDQIWSSKDCPAAIPTQDVVVRRASVTQVPVIWNSRRSDEECRTAPRGRCRASTT